MTRLRILFLSICSLCSTQAGAQTVTPDRAIGWRIAKFANPTGTGAETLDAVVHYPAKKDAKRPRNAALRPGTDRFPVIVFLHGYGASGGVMLSIGQHFAERGYVVVLTNTTRTGRGKQAVNAKAFYRALAATNEEKDGKDSRSFLAGRLDMAKVGIAGHSMGGGNAMRVLGDDNPGYRAGFCFAPWTTAGAREKDYVPRFAGRVEVPLAIVHGVKDRVLPWRANAVRLYDAISDDHAFKALWVLDEKASHVNVAVPAMLAASSDATFLLCANLATAFFGRFLKGQAEALDPFLDKKKPPTGVRSIQVHLPTKQSEKKAPPKKRKI